MFALEINFQDGVSSPELLFVRRPQALIGSSDFAHVVIEDMKSLDYQLRIVRGVGRRFRIQPVALSAQSALPNFLEGLHEGEAFIDLGVVQLSITVLDTDLMLREKEPPDRAGVRVLRQSCTTNSPSFPAIVVIGKPPMVVSFVPEQPIYIGRSKRCAVRLDSADVSGEHARIGYESGEFWIEDLGSTNGTFIKGQQISGRQKISAVTPVVLAREISIVGVTSEEQIQHISSSGMLDQKAPAQDNIYPILISKSELVRPARLTLKPGTTLNVGRDPSSDIWLGAPHVSRKHCVVAVSKTGMISITDHSTNGTAHDEGILRKGDIIELGSSAKVIDFGGGITIGICFTKDQEQQFLSSNGARNTFRNTPLGVEGNASVPGAVSTAEVGPDLKQGYVVEGRRLLLSNIFELFMSYGLFGRLLLLLILVFFVVSLVVLVYLLIPII